MDSWFFVPLGVAGAVLVATGRPRLMVWANLLWLAANGGLMIHNAIAGDYGQAVLFGVYLALAWIGFWKWLR